MTLILFDIELVFVYNETKMANLFAIDGAAVMRERSKLSDRQRSILRFMETYLERNGFPPTIREIGEATGINSTSVVNYILNKLVSAGYLARSARASRGIRLVKGSTASSANRKTAAVHNVQAAAKLARVPMVGQIVASEPVSIPEDMGYYYDEDSVIEVPPAMLNGADPSEVFALRVKGDSMIDAMVALFISLLPWRPVTCAISWASTPASCDSFSAASSSPRCIKRKPPGKANALISFVFRTVTFSGTRRSEYLPTFCAREST